MCLYVCDQETPKREAKGPSWTISACEWMMYCHFAAHKNISCEIYKIYNLHPYKISKL
jgi:hypothetical protein